MAEISANPVAVVRADLALMQLMPSLEQAFLQTISTDIVAEGATVGDGEKGDGKGHGDSAGSSDARTGSEGFFACVEGAVVRCLARSRRLE